MARKENQKEEFAMKIMNETECCEYLKVKRVTLWRWRKDQGLPFAKIGQKVFFPQKLIDEWLLSKIKKEKPRC